MTTAPVKASYDPRPVRRYLNPFYREEIFEAWMAAYLSEWRAGAVGNDLVLVFHPDEALARPTNDLMDFGPHALDRNLRLLRQALDSADIDYRFCALREAAQC